MKTKLVSFVAMAAVSAASLCGTCRADDLYHYITQIPIGGEGGWDYLSIDPRAHRLYVSHASEIVVIDLKNNQIIGAITNTPGVHGIALAPKLGLGVTSDGRESKAGIVDLKTLQILSKVDTADGPDGFAYNPRTREAYL
ncbi:MAG: YncE family protein, partial [Limisphaerales bacterium]